MKTLPELLGTLEEIFENNVLSTKILRDWQWFHFFMFSKKYIQWRSFESWRALFYEGKVSTSEMGIAQYENNWALEAMRYVTFF